MKNTILLIIVTLFLSTAIAIADDRGFEYDSTGTPMGTAKQPDLDMHSKDILNIHDIEANETNTNILNTDTGSITNVTSSEAIITTANVGLIVANQITVSRTPTHSSDLTNREYVIGKYNQVVSAINQLQAQINAKK